MEQPPSPQDGQPSARHRSRAGSRSRPGAEGIPAGAEQHRTGARIDPGVQGGQRNPGGPNRGWDSAGTETLYIVNLSGGIVGPVGVKTKIPSLAQREMVPGAGFNFKNITGSLHLLCPVLCFSHHACVGLHGDGVFSFLCLAAWKAHHLALRGD